MIPKRGSLFINTFSSQVRATSAFINDPDFSYEKINKSSKACGPLVQWASAQVRLTSVTFVEFVTSVTYVPPHTVSVGARPFNVFHVCDAC